MESQKIIALVVTYNRLELFKKTIEGLRNQTRKPNQILVVNNSSTDGTDLWLSEQTDLKVITQPNIGSSGGQYTGSKEAMKENPDWIWLMDDDVIPTEYCLENLIKFAGENKIIAPLRQTPNGDVFLNDTIIFNLNNPFKSIWTRILSKNDLENDLIAADGITFEGPMIHKDVFLKIGYPEKNFFIYGDDSEFFIRAKKSGFNSFIAVKALLKRQLEAPLNEHIFTWKHFFMIRNIIVIDLLHASIIVKLLRPWGYLITWLKRAKSKEDFKAVIQGFISAYFYKSVIK